MLVLIVLDFRREFKLSFVLIKKDKTIYFNKKSLDNTLIIKTL